MSQADANAIPSTGAAGPEVAAAPQRVTVPPERYDRFRIWSSFFIAVLVCLPPLLVEFSRPDVVSGHEATVLLKSRETWEKVRDGATLAWLIPASNDEPALDPPPMVVWLHMASWQGLDPDTASPRELVLRARLVTIGMALLALCATYWAGMSIGGVRVARIATMALGTSLLFIIESRYAGLQVVTLGWTTMAIAAALWAMRPLKPINWVGRRVSGWLVAGLATGGAVMTVGPTAVLFIVPPIFAAILLTPFRRLDNSLGLLFAMILGSICVAPWYLYVMETVPDAWERLLGHYEAPRDLFLLSWSHSRALIVLAPWQVWILGAMCQPFIRANAQERRQLLIAWLWFVLLFIIFSIPAARHPRYLVPMLPAAALMVGQLWSFHARLASERLEDPGINLLRVPHWLLMGLASIIGPGIMIAQEELVSRGLMDDIEMPGMPWQGWATLGAVLLLIAVLGTRWHFKWRPRLAAYATVAWMITATTFCLFVHSRSVHSRSDFKSQAARLSEMTGQSELVYLARSPADVPPDPRFLFYLGRSIHAVTPEQLEALATSDEPLVLMTRGDKPADELLVSSGFVQFATLDEPQSRGRALYRRR
jgi:4-amino-4-deoxy-L-arabinose transferase-like glycosyltransferase